MTDRTHTLTARRLEAWANDLDDREAALAVAQAQFDQHVAEFEARTEAMVDRAADRSLTEAVHIVRRGFPEGIFFPPTGPSGCRSVH